MATYDPNWRQKALDAGIDQNLPQFAEMRALEQQYNRQQYEASPERQLELAQKVQQQQLQFRKQANVPIASSMRAGIPTLQARYKQILDDLTFRESEESAKVQTRVAREYGRRGVPLSSDIFARSQEEELQPTKRFYAGERSNVGITEQEKLDQINQAIAMLEAGSPAESIPQGIGLFGNVSSSLESAENRRVQQEQFDRQLAQALKIAEMEKESKTNNLADLWKLFMS